MMLLLNSLVCFIYSQMDKWSRQPSSKIHSTGYGFKIVKTDE